MPLAFTQEDFLVTSAIRVVAKIRGSSNTVMKQNSQSPIQSKYSFSITMHGYYYKTTGMENCGFKPILSSWAGFPLLFSQRN